MNRVLLIVGGLLVGLLAALFAVPSMVDWTRYRGAFEEEASRMLGREVRVGGRVDMRLLPTPYIRFEKVRIADARASVGEPFFRADDFTVWLAIGPLLGGAFEATEVELRRPVLTFVMDGEGAGNWTDLSAGRRADGRGFVPASVRLQTMRITNGTVRLFGPSGGERVRLERINGEMSAEALEGPYRVTAAFAVGEQMRELRLSTAPPAPDGSFRLKGTVRAPQSGTSVTVDGTVRDVTRRLKIDGEVTARLPLPTVPGAEPTAATAPAGRSATPESVIDLKAALKADTAGVDLGDIQLSFEQDGRPQLAAGTARVEWRERTDVRADLQSRWLDLDRIAGATAVQPPLAVLRRFALGLAEGLPSGGRTALKLDVDQATIGGDAVSRIALALERTEAGLVIRSLAASLPGGSRLRASGSMVGGGADIGFDGEVDVRGASFARFLGWSAGSAAAQGVRRDGPYAVAGQVKLDRHGIAGRRLAVQLAGSTLSGDASWTSEPVPRLALALEGTEIDVTPLLDGKPTPVAALRALVRNVEAVAAASGATASSRKAEVQLKLRVGRLVAGTVTLRDVASDVRLADGNLTMPHLRFGGGGWTLDLGGDVAGVLDAGAKGALTVLATAETVEGLAELVGLAELPVAPFSDTARTAAMLPMRMAARIGIGEKGAGSIETAVDGTLATTRVAGTLRLDGATRGWREQRIDASLALDAGDATQLVALLAARVPARNQDANAGPITSGGRIVLRMVGTAKDGLATLAALDVEGGRSEARGRLAIDETATPSFEGDLTVDASDLGRAVASLVRQRPGLAGIAVRGGVGVKVASGRVVLDAQQLRIGGADVSGKLDLDLARSPVGLAGQIETSSLALPRALALLTEGRGAPRREADGSLWPDHAFDASLLGIAEGRLSLAVGALDLARDMPLRGARLDIGAGKGGLRIELVEARGLGGRVDASFALEPSPGGVRIAGKARLAGARLEALGLERQPALARGGLALEIDLEGSALTPRGLVAALRGQGEVRVIDAELARLAPSTLRDVAQVVLTRKGELVQADVRRLIHDAASKPHAPVAIGRRTLAVDLREGAIRVAPLVREAADGRVAITVTADLDTARVDGEWRVEGKAPVLDEKPAGGRARPDLAPLVVVWAGPIGEIGALAPRIDSDAIEQELLVRKVERDVEMLERLRREDEERAREERARAAEAERARLERERAERERIERERGAAPGRQAAPGAAAPGGSTGNATPGLLSPAPPAAAAPSPQSAQPPAQRAPATGATGVEPPASGRQGSQLQPGAAPAPPGSPPSPLPAPAEAPPPMQAPAPKAAPPPPAPKFIRPFGIEDMQRSGS